VVARHCLDSDARSSHIESRTMRCTPSTQEYFPRWLLVRSCRVIAAVPQLIRTSRSVIRCDRCARSSLVIPMLDPCSDGRIRPPSRTRSSTPLTVIDSMLGTGSNHAATMQTPKQTCPHADCRFGCGTIRCTGVRASVFFPIPTSPNALTR
jgi:hypothetical protein